MPGIEHLPSEIFALGFSAFKQKFINQFFPQSRITFIDATDNVPVDATVLIWGNRTVSKNGRSGHSDFNLLRVEDGFLRSVGLGADFQVPPVSWVVDSRGMYFDSTQPSDLEVILQTAEFSETLLTRARSLRSKIVDNRLTKYNVGHARKINYGLSSPIGSHVERKIILVPGQVESDASILYGAPGIRQNMALLQEVRKQAPDAYIVYKPHPDVVSGLRGRGAGESGAGQWCNEVITDIDMADLLLQVDEVHVLTSLTGFEALLRGKRVVCYGQPFYAGWGLTEDRLAVVRRTRRLTLDELVAGALVLYPLYLSPVSHTLITAEQAVEELLAWRSKGHGKLSLRHRLGRILHKMVKPK